VPEKGLRPRDWARSVRVARFRGLVRPSKISAGCVGAFRERFSLSGWVWSVPYPFLPQMAKVELEGGFSEVRMQDPA